MAQKFLEAGYEWTEFDQKADVYIINTCTVTSMSDKKSRQMLRKARALNEKAIIVAVGCYAQVSKNELEKIPEIDLILGINEKNDIVKYVEQYKTDATRIEIASDVMHQREFLDFGEITFSEKTRAVIKIEDGCDRFCSYCIIPYARGRVRSRKPESILREMEQLAKREIKEVVLTGIHIASYGKDLEQNITLIDLLEQLNQVNGIQRIRLGSLEPTIITDDFVKRVTKLEKVCNHFHLSLQSACDATLKRMNRRYTVEEFKQCIKRLRDGYHNEVTLTTDVIVGFPGETETEFQTTLANLQEMHFTKMHVFKFSPRKGTKAFEMKEQISPEIKEKRSKKVIELSDKNEREYEKQYEGKIIPVLMEKIEGDWITGHSTNYLKVCAPKMNVENEIVMVKIEKAKKGELMGEILTDFVTELK